MGAEVLALDPHRPDRAALGRAGDILRAGGLVAFPTETVYGLGANAFDATAVDGIFRAKGRPANDPVIVHVAHREQLAHVTSQVPKAAQQLIDAFWPGPLTLVLPRGERVPLVVTAGLDTVAVRMPSHPVALGLIEAAGVPVAAPSANAFSRPSATTAEHVMADLGDRIDLVLDAGPTPIGVESTIVAVSPGQPVTVLRPGGVPLEALQRMVERVELRSRGASDSDALPQLAPGLLSKHYSPRARFLLVTGPRPAARQRLQREVQRASEHGQRVGVLLVDEDRELVTDLPVIVGQLGSETDLDGIAERLFRAMRSVDASGVDVIITRSVGTSGLGLAILDRLTRAAAGIVIDAGEARD